MNEKESEDNLVSLYVLKYCMYCVSFQVYQVPDARTVRRDLAAAHTSRQEVRRDEAGQEDEHVWRNIYELIDRDGS